MRSSEEELSQLKTKIQNAKIELNKLEGQRIALLERLRTEFQLDSLEEAEAQLEKLEREKEVLERKLGDKLETVKGLCDDF